MLRTTLGHLLRLFRFLRGQRINEKYGKKDVPSFVDKIRGDINGTISDADHEHSLVCHFVDRRALVLDTVNYLPGKRLVAVKLGLFRRHMMARGNANVGRDVCLLLACLGVFDRELPEFVIVL